ncbi:hypothetical protein PGTUg99_002679 [Puccinia graminis f. sp. tritici]|uniref:Uncharacterized protein n=1 Tax=Puccinia graminis f. sp. tritici TaxID=56615 RepID=A0A5B0SAE7_PUCGR|nr:hypothetical protein PGTUg99_002679 [Puccinia graminis f. sp. tritici]
MYIPFMLLLASLMVFQPTAVSASPLQGLGYQGGSILPKSQCESDPDPHCPYCDHTC